MWRDVDCREAIFFLFSINLKEDYCRGGIRGKGVEREEGEVKRGMERVGFRGEKKGEERSIGVVGLDLRGGGCAVGVKGLIFGDV